MSVIDYVELFKLIGNSYSKAKEAIGFSLTESFSAISNRIPGYDVKKVEFGAYLKDNFTVLFADMRDSTGRSNRIGPENTFITLHALIPAMIYIIEKYNGTIIDLPGDGIMALFKENRTNVHWTKDGKEFNKESLAVVSAQKLMETIQTYINGLLVLDNIEDIHLGIGIDTGDVIVTKIGTNNTFDSKAIGDCINNASKMSKGNDEIIISQDIYDSLPENLQKDFLIDKTTNKFYYKI